MGSWQRMILVGWAFTAAAASVHAADDAIPRRRAGRVLDEEGVKVGLNDHAAVRSSIKADKVITS